jgi:hypothetical protein
MPSVDGIFVSMAKISQKYSKYISAVTELSHYSHRLVIIEVDTDCVLKT